MSREKLNKNKNFVKIGNNDTSLTGLIWLEKGKKMLNQEQQRKKDGRRWGHYNLPYRPKNNGIMRGFMSN